MNDTDEPGAHRDGGATAARPGLGLRTEEGIDRRAFLKRGGALVGGAAASSLGWARAAEPIDPAHPPWMREPGAPFSNYGRPSEHEAKTIRWIAAHATLPGNGVSWCPLHALAGTVTPNGLHFERHHNGVPRIDPDHHQLLVHGLVERALAFKTPDLMRYPMRSELIFLECGGNSNAGWNKVPLQTSVSYLHGLVSCSEWTGVPLSLVLDEARVKPEARWLIAEGADAFAMSMSIPMEKAMDDALLALYQNGERIRPENGYPLRLILPGWEGVLNVKWLRRLTATRDPIMARNETSRYTELLPSGLARQFTFLMEAKSLITSPSMTFPVPAPGLHEIRGIAWSGSGRVTRVEVSTDGGSSWHDANLQEPVLPRCLTRFRMPWRWDGRPTTLQSRATDETGYRQPERSKLIAARGRHGFFHYNAIVSWHVHEDGRLSHVYV